MEWIQADLSQTGGVLYKQIRDTSLHKPGSQPVKHHLHSPCIFTEPGWKYKLGVSPVTFDQPLYIKAAEIVQASQALNQIIVRLGGCQLILSYMGQLVTSWVAVVYKANGRRSTHQTQSNPSWQAMCMLVHYKQTWILLLLLLKWCLIRQTVGMDWT